MSDICAYHDQLINVRRHLHTMPEEGWCEFRTTAYLIETLRGYGYEVLTGTKVIDPESCLGRNPKLVEAAQQYALENGVSQAMLDEMEGFTGCCAVMDTGRPGPTLAVRFDIDCIPVQESHEPDHKPAKEGFVSERPGFMHACGHDAHMSTGLALAHWFADHKDEMKGRIKFLFQPAEEGVRGAAAMAARGIVDDVDWFAGAHIGCSAKLHEVGVSHHGYLATTKFDLDITGVPCAAGSPENGKSALMCGAALCMSLGSLPGHSQGITRVQIGKFVSGTGRNIVAEHASMLLEVRGESTEINDYMAAGVERTVAGLCAAYGCTYSLRRVGEAVTYKGDEEAVELVKDAARAVPTVTSVVDMNAKVGSEDCTMLIRRVQAHGGKAVFFYFGCEHHGHHKPDFDIQDTASLRDGWGVFTGFLARTNGRKA